MAFHIKVCQTDSMGPNGFFVHLLMTNMHTEFRSVSASRRWALHYDVFLLLASSGWRFDDDTVLMHRCIQGDSLYIPERFGVEGELYVDATRT